MSKATKRKYVAKEVMEDYALPENGRQVVKVVSSRGNNLHEVESASGEHFLASMPTKFRKNVWIKRDDYLMVEPIEEGDKVKAEISHILYKSQIQYIQQQGLWPEQFAPSKSNAQSSASGIPDDMLPPSDGSDHSDSDCDEKDYSATVCNPNRRDHLVHGTDETDSDDTGESEHKQ